VGLVVAALAVGLPGAAPASGQVRGFDGTTITVAGLGNKAQLAGAETGARARIQRFNDSNELAGVKVEYTDFADDKQDPAVALSEARRLVSQEGVFAIVGDASANNPVDYLAQNHVPYFGGGFDSTYCSSRPSTSLWGFSSEGCIVPQAPSFVSDIYRAQYQYASQKLGKQHPTMVIFGGDTDSGKDGTRIFSVAAQGAGFQVVDVQNNIPTPPVSDYTPYVQQVMTGNKGGQPDVVFCVGAVQCLPMYQLLQQSGFKGVYIHGLYTDILVQALSGSAVNEPFVNPNDDTAGVRQMKSDLDDYRAGAGSKVDVATAFGYTSTDMFLRALETVAKGGKSKITPDNVRKAASTMTWQIKGLAGPVRYPKATVIAYPACFTVLESDGAKWNTVVPFGCSTKTYRPSLKVG
jgi:ABC-type branched-subunit amino acid transport system substrate-binding protein